MYGKFWKKQVQSYVLSPLSVVMVNLCCLRTRPGHPEPGPILINSRPSEMIGQSVTNAISPTISKLAEVSSMHENRGLMAVHENSGSSNNGVNSLMNLAEALLGQTKPGKPPPLMGNSQRNAKEGIDLVPTIRELAPGAQTNFGLPKGEGYFQIK